MLDRGSSFLWPRDAFRRHDGDNLLRTGEHGDRSNVVKIYVRIDDNALRARICSGGARQGNSEKDAHKEE
jgi:hypothetical protein